MEANQVDQGFLPLIADKFGDSIVEASWTGSEAQVTARPDHIAAILQFVRDHPDISLLYPADLTAFDTGENIVIVYRLVSLQKKHSLILRVSLPREDPHIATATALWLGVNWHEREVFDLFGVRFDGHPDLRRILLPDEWVGYPFRKDYVSIPSGDPHFGPQPMDLPGDSA